MAEELILSGISVLPVTEKKTPAMKSWSHLQDHMMTIDESEKLFYNCYGIGVICGKVSGYLEAIDFDAHNKDIQQIYDAFTKNDGINFILESNNIYIERSKRGGYHIIYRYESDKKPDGPMKLAFWDMSGGPAESMIETRGEGSYIIIAPTEGYTPIKGDMLTLSLLPEEQRDYLISFARSFNQLKDAEIPTESKQAPFDVTDPVSWYNWNKADAAKMLLKDKGWQYIGFNETEKVEQWRRPGKTDGVSATWGKNYNALFVFTSSVEYFMQNCYYTPFQILVKLKYSGNYRQAIGYVQSKYFNEESDYIRVGTDYYKKIKKSDRFGIVQLELKPWRKDEIKQDHGSAYLKKIPLYDDFTILPNNVEYHPVYENCYNLYKEFTHRPEHGSWHWTQILIKHVFGEQYELGLRYLQALYLNPKRNLPILVLVSKERQTGKTTFINWLNMVFGNNMVNINPEDLTSQFNGSYATSNIIAVEETLIEKSVTVEKLKALATGKFISVNNKFVNPYKVPFYGKIILASNNEEKFARIDDEEIRFFVRKLGKPTHSNHSIEDDMVTEIPAFLHYLTTLDPIDWSKDRSGFTPDELVNDSLLRVKQESKSSLFKEMHELISEHFLNDGHTLDSFQATPTDIKTKWFEKNSRIDVQYIIHVLKNEMNLTPAIKAERYLPFGVDSSGGGLNTRIGKPYLFKRFTEDENDINYSTNDELPF